MKKRIAIIIIIFITVCLSISNVSADPARDHAIENIFIVTGAAVLGTALIHSLNSRDDHRHHQRIIHPGKNHRRWNAYKRHHRWNSHKKYDRWYGHYPGYTHRYRYDKRRQPHYNNHNPDDYREFKRGRHKNLHHKRTNDGHSSKRGDRKTNRYER